MPIAISKATTTNAPTSNANLMVWHIGRELQSDDKKADAKMA
jgi:hypothetical protein